jgi:hypothetical protein
VREKSITSLHYQGETWSISVSTLWPISLQPSAQFSLPLRFTDDDEMTGEDSTPPSEGVDGLLYFAWTVIANSPGWDENTEWKQAAEAWRKRWYAYLDWAKTDKDEIT